MTTEFYLICIFCYFQRLNDSHDQFKLTLNEADKEFNAIIGLSNEVIRISQQYGITGGYENPYSFITGQVCVIIVNLLVFKLLLCTLAVTISQFG